MAYGDGGGQHAGTVLFLAHRGDPAATAEPPRPAGLPGHYLWVPADARHVAGWRHPGPVPSSDRPPRRD